MKKILCLFPFTYLAIHQYGEVYFCCPYWNKHGSIGNLQKNPIEKIWNGPKAQSVRAKMYEGKWETICNKDYCPVYIAQQSRTVEEWLKIDPTFKPIVKDLKNKKTILSYGPMDVAINDSGECNLRCKMCTSNEKFQSVDKNLSKKIFQETLPSLLPHIRYLLFTGNGEPFYRKETREFMQNFNPKKYPNLKFNILSNGLLLNKKMWNSIKHNQFNFINISIDAATKETYEKTRIGGKWKVLQENLRMLSQLRQKGKFKHFQINMVVMKSNYREMKQFARLGKKLKYGYFNLGCLEENINLYPDPKVFLEIKKTLKDSLFADPIMDTFRLQTYKNFQSSQVEKAEMRKVKIKNLFFHPLYKLYFQIPQKYRPIRFLKRHLLMRF